MLRILSIIKLLIKNNSTNVTQATNKLLFLKLITSRLSTLIVLDLLLTKETVPPLIVWLQLVLSMIDGAEQDNKVSQYYLLKDHLLVIALSINNVKKVLFQEPLIMLKFMGL